jgi:hypothetical protein
MMEMIKVALVAALLVLFCYVIVVVKRRRKSNNLYSSISGNNHRGSESPVMTSPMLRSQTGSLHLPLHPPITDNILYVLLASFLVFKFQHKISHVLSL